MTDWWRQGPARPWWALLPLRAFLGFTFTFAGLQKLANPAYLDAHSPTSVQATILSLRHQSPIGFLLGASAHAPVLTGIVIALGELAVGLATLLGLWLRVAAVGGLLLALTFFLTVSFHTAPYYYGSDIVFVFAWSVPLLLGTLGGPSVDAWIRQRAAGDADPQRRALVLGGVSAGVLAAGLGALAGVVAAIGRALHESPRRTAVIAPSHASATPSASSSSSPSAAAAPANAITKVSAVPTGQALAVDTNSGPAWLVHENDGGFRMFSAVCTHAGCTVSFDSGSQSFVCPCHGGHYSAADGSVLGGPPPRPLDTIPVKVVGGDVVLG